MHRSSSTIRLKYSRVDLLAKLKENRAAHASAYSAAIVAHREKLTKILQKMLAKCATATQLTHADQMINLPIPERHLEEYDCTIRMLEMTTEAEVVLSYDEFAQLVLDQWDWSASFFSNTVSYIASVP